MKGKLGSGDNWSENVKTDETSLIVLPVAATIMPDGTINSDIRHNASNFETRGGASENHRIGTWLFFILHSDWVHRNPPHHTHTPMLPLTLSTMLPVLFRSRNNFRFTILIAYIIAPIFHSLLSASASLSLSLTLSGFLWHSLCPPPSLSLSLFFS